MAKPTAYADFQNLDDTNRLRLTCAGTLQDLTRQGIQLRQGMVLTFYTDDADEHGRPDELLAEGTVEYDDDSETWVATIDWAAIRHALGRSATRGQAFAADLIADGLPSSGPRSAATATWPWGNPSYR